MTNAIKNFIFGTKKPVPFTPIVVKDIDRIADSIEKVDKMVVRMKTIGNHDGITTWMIVRKKLQLEWDEAMLCVNSKKGYQYVG